MFHIPYNDLEEARVNPELYRSKLDDSSSHSWFPSKPSYFTTLKNAIFSYHSNNDNVVTGMSYLEEKLENYKNPQKCLETVDTFNWYVTDYINRNWKAFDTKIKVRTHIPLLNSETIIFSGEVSRIDFHPTNGYVAWLFKNSHIEQWKTQLQMPLIQDEVSKELNAPIEEVTIGIYFFPDRQIDLYSYSQDHIFHAHQNLRDLIQQMGFSVLNS